MKYLANTSPLFSGDCNKFRTHRNQAWMTFHQFSKATGQRKKLFFLLFISLKNMHVVNGHEKKPTVFPAQSTSDAI